MLRAPWQGSRTPGLLGYTSAQGARAVTTHAGPNRIPAAPHSLLFRLSCHLLAGVYRDEQRSCLQLSLRSGDAWPSWSSGRLTPTLTIISSPREAKDRLLRSFSVSYQEVSPRGREGGAGGQRQREDSVGPRGHSLSASLSSKVGAVVGPPP